MSHQDARKVFWRRNKASDFGVIAFKKVEHLQLMIKKKTKKRNILLIQLYCPQHNLEHCTFKSLHSRGYLLCPMLLQNIWRNYLKRQKMGMTYALKLHIIFFVSTKLRFRNVRGNVAIQLNPHRVCHVFMATVINDCNTWSGIFRWIIHHILLFYESLAHLLICVRERSRLTHKVS